MTGPMLALAIAPCPAATPARPARRRRARQAAPPTLRIHAPALSAEDLRHALTRDLYDLVADAVAGFRDGGDWAPGIQLRIHALAAAAAPIPA